MWGLVAVMAAKALMDTSSAFSSAKAEKAQLKHQARMAEINADLSRHKAEGAFVQGRSQIASTMRQHGQALAQQRASMASRGIDMGYGSAAETRATAEFFAETDYNTMSANALRNAWGYKQEATNYENQALMARANANAIDPGKQAFFSLLGSAAQSYAGYAMATKTDALGDWLGDMKDKVSGWFDSGNAKLGATLAESGYGFKGTGLTGFGGFGGIGSAGGFNMPALPAIQDFYSGSSLNYLRLL